MRYLLCLCSFWVGLSFLISCWLEFGSQASDLSNQWKLYVSGVVVAAIVGYCTNDLAGSDSIWSRLQVGILNAICSYIPFVGYFLIAVL